VTTRDDDEPIALRSVPFALPDPEHGYVFLVFGTLAAGNPTYEPDPALAARMLSRGQRWEQRALWEEERAA
jgi:hypothetical protein